MPDVFSTLDRLRYWTLYPAAQTFIRNHLETMAREGMTESQMGGLQALFAAGEKIDKVKKFAEVRVQRFRDAGRPDQQEFWATFLRYYEEYRKQAPQLLTGATVSADESSRLVIEAFVRHLIAENRYRQKVPFTDEGKGEEKDARETSQPVPFQRGDRPGHRPPRGRGDGNRGGAHR